MPGNQSITVQVRLDEKTFRRFARFDMLSLRRKWVKPVVFALILCAFAAVALISRLPQSGMIAAVLLAVGLGLPIVYIGMFLSQVNMQASKWRLGKGRNVYTVKLTEEGFQVTNPRKQENTGLIPWEKAAQAFRRKDCIYLYATPAKAFLLPNGQADAPDDAVWAYIRNGIGSQKSRESGIRPLSGKSPAQS